MENTYHCYANRELSWLRFNERVLEEAEDTRLPLCERLSFLSIFQSNLDEFFMVRIGSLQDQMLLDKNARENKTNMTSGEQIEAVLASTHKLTARRDAAYNGLLEQLAEQGIRLLDFAHMEEESRAELILHFLPLLYKGYKVTSKTLARITRNADIDADLIYDEDLNYRDHMAEVVKKRKKLAPVRLELSREIDEEIIQSLCKNLKLDPKRVFEYDSPLDHSFLFQIRDQLRSHTDLFFAPRHPQPSPTLDERKPIIPQILEEDKLLHYPYESIRPFLQLLHEAACDPDVVSIKMTLYRLANHSKVVDALVEAAENGKQVDVLVELKARFDEENNIEWSRLLERAGCHVVYGIEGLKVHSKLCLITRKTKEGISFITQIGTGNYNEKTSRLYTDLSFLTASKEIGLEATEVFRALDQGETVDSVKNLLVAPHCLQNRLLNQIDGEIEAAARGEGGYIGIKINSLTDKVLINKLIEASQAGVHIDMVVRGICCLRAGVPDETENIHIISIVGRYLEHSRIYIFGRGARARYYIGSADWMTRSTLRRVEIAAPVTAPALKARLQHIFDTMLEQLKEKFFRETAAQKQPEDAAEAFFRAEAGQYAVVLFQIDDFAAQASRFGSNLHEKLERPMLELARQIPRLAGRTCIRAVSPERYALRYRVQDASRFETTLPSVVRQVQAVWRDYMNLFPAKALSAPCAGRWQRHRRRSSWAKAVTC